MSAITFLASSKPFIIPDEIEEFNNRTFSKKRNILEGYGCMK